jgi:hypothetical protein
MDAKKKPNLIPTTCRALGSSDAISYHDPANRGDSQIRFIAPQAAPATDDGEVTSLELKMVNYTIPSRVTRFFSIPWCPSFGPSPFILTHWHSPHPAQSKPPFRSAATCAPTIE